MCCYSLQSSHAIPNGNPLLLHGCELIKEYIYMHMDTYMYLCMFVKCACAQHFAD
jgi:hypothetical protein